MRQVSSPSVRFQLWDYLILAVYWIITAGIIYYSLLHMPEPPGRTVIIGSIIFTILLGTGTVMAVVYGIRFLTANRQFTFYTLLCSVLLVSGLLYMIVYSSVVYGDFKITWRTWAAGILQHIRSYGLLLLIFYIRKSTQIWSEMLRINDQKNEEEKLRLKTRISPHFLLNTLHNLYPLIQKGHDMMLDRISIMLRYFLYECKNEVITLQQELTFITSYLQMERGSMPYPETLRINIEKITESFVIVPGVLIQFIENAFKHYGATKKDYIDLELKLKGDSLHFRLSNSFFPGGSDDEAVDGIGLETARRTLDLTYGTRYRMEVTDRDSRYSADLTLPLQYYGKN